VSIREFRHTVLGRKEPQIGAKSTAKDTHETFFASHIDTYRYTTLCSEAEALVEFNKLNYSKDEAAGIIGVSQHTITRDIRMGRIRAIKYGRRILIPATEIRRIAEQGMPVTQVGAAHSA
jgi:excisionase family DNA binding protein